MNGFQSFLSSKKIVTAIATETFIIVIIPHIILVKAKRTLTTVILKLPTTTCISGWEVSATPIPDDKKKNKQIH